MTASTPCLRKYGKERRPCPGKIGDVPDACFMFTKDCIVIDHRDRKLFIFSSPFLTYDTDIEGEYQKCAERIHALADHIRVLASKKKPRNTKQMSTGKCIPFSSQMSKETFERSVDLVKEHIIAGDIFQAVLSRRIECRIADDPFTVYTALREINPSPYMYYLDFGEEKIIGASPEMLVRVEKRRVTTVPDSGTRPRGKPRKRMNSSRRISWVTQRNVPNIPCLWILQGTISGGSAVGSVEVSEFMTIEKFSHVQHIVSTVKGTLKDNLDCYDAFRSVLSRRHRFRGAERSG